MRPARRDWRRNALGGVARRKQVESSFDLLDRPNHRPRNGIAKPESDDASKCERNDNPLCVGVRLGACFDSRDHVRLGLVDQLVGQTFKPVSQRRSLCRLQVSRFGCTTSANQIHDARHDLDEPVVALSELSKQFDFVLSDEQCADPRSAAIDLPALVF
jgi:hypothetical protein